MPKSRRMQTTTMTAVTSLKNSRKPRKQTSPCTASSIFYQVGQKTTENEMKCLSQWNICWKMFIICVLSAHERWVLPILDGAKSKLAYLDHSWHLSVTTLSFPSPGYIYSFLLGGVSAFVHQHEQWQVCVTKVLLAPVEISFVPQGTGIYWLHPTFQWAR